MSFKTLYKSNRMLRIAIQLLLVLAVYWGVSFWQSRDYVRGDAPNLNAQFLSGESFELYTSEKKPVLVHFWATWCPICELENDNIQALHGDYNVVTIASWSENAEAVAAYMKEHELTFPVIVDEDGEWAKLYNVKGVPASFFINSERQIKMIERGYTTEAGYRLRLWWLMD